MLTEGIANHCKELAALVTRHTEGKGDSIHPTAIDQLSFTRSDAVSTALHDVFEPIRAIVVQRELYYRLLIGEQGEAVRQIATSGSNMQRIASAIKLIKSDFTKPMRSEDLAGRVSMSTSSFHQHFKQVTWMSPLQYQKQLRLLEARRLMLTENADAMYAAYQVGYESPSQFSREYSRLFGAPPIRDIERLRTA